MENLQIKLRNTVEELEGQRNICRTTLRRAAEAENHLNDTKQRTSGLEGELLSSDVELDQLREDRRKVSCDIYIYIFFFNESAISLNPFFMNSQRCWLFKVSCFLFCSICSSARN